jgi:hypothetical protein
MDCWGKVHDDEANCAGPVRPGATSEFITGSLRADFGYCDFHRYTRSSKTMTKRTAGYKSLAGRPLPLEKGGDSE